MDPDMYFNAIVGMSLALVTGIFFYKAIRSTLKFIRGTLWVTNLVFNRKKIQSAKIANATKPIQAVLKGKSEDITTDLPKTIQLFEFQKDQDWSGYETPTYLRKGVIIH